MENLDLACAKIGKIITENRSETGEIIDDKKWAKELESLVTNALAVLEEQGVYAFFLFLKAEKDDKEIINKLETFLKTTPKQAPMFTDQNVFASLRDRSSQLDRLLLTRDLIWQTLVYARHHARALQKKGV